MSGRYFVAPSKIKPGWTAIYDKGSYNPWNGKKPDYANINGGEEIAAFDREGHANCMLTIYTEWEDQRVRASLGIYS